VLVIEGDGIGKNTGFGLFLVRDILEITITETGTCGEGARSRCWCRAERTGSPAPREGIHEQPR